MSLRDRPTLSVVIASPGSAEDLAACLASLADQARRHEAEIVVARNPGDLETLRKAHPTVRFVVAASPADAPTLRALGLTAASGDIVAFGEDHLVMPSDWLDRLTGAKPASDAAAAGETDWSAYLERQDPENGSGADSSPPQ